MGRSPCCDENGLKKGPWTPEEDHKLVQYIQKHGHGSWRALPKLAGLNRCGKSCRLRWTNYLRPDIKRGKFSQEEEQTILHLHSILGNKWSAIATHLPGRTDNEIKNFWNTHLKKKLIQMGFDPMTHRPRTDLFSSLPQLIALANLKELIMDHHHQQQWDHQDHAALRLQAEAVQLAKLQYLQYLLQTATAATSSMAPTNTSNTTTTSNNNNNNNIADMEAFNNIAGNWNGFCQLESPNSCSFGTVPRGSINQMVQSEIQFSQLSDLHQLPCNDISITMNNKLSNSSENIMAADQSSISFPVFCEGDEAAIIKSSPSTPWINPNNGDGCSSSSSYGGGSSSSAAAPSFWPELFLEDPFVHEIA